MYNFASRTTVKKTGRSKPGRLIYLLSGEMAVRDGSRDRTRDRKVLPSDLKPPKDFHAFLRISIQTGERLPLDEINDYSRPARRFLFHVK
jgi:hypothetical protein